MKKRIRLLLIILILALLSGCSATTSASASSKTTAKQVERGDLILGLSADGKIKLPVTNLNFEVEGTIKNIYVSSGDYVKKGDVLAELDDTDLQLALSNAKISLEKANLAYEDTITSGDYNLKVELANLDTLKKKQDTPFDEYTYQTAISNAELTLQRKKADLEDAEKTLEDSKGETKEPTNLYSYETAIANAKTNLERKEADLADAKKTLSDAENEAIEAFDEYTYKNAVTSAQTTLDRKKDELYDAEQAVWTAYYSLQSSYSSGDADKITKAESEYTSAQSKVTTAENSLADAETALKTAKENLERAKKTYNEDEAEKKQTEIDDAAKKVETAQQAYDDAKTSLANAYTNLENAKNSNVESAEKSLETAKRAYEDAVTSLQKAKDDLERAIKTYNDDLETTKASLQTQALKIDNLQNSSTSIRTALYNIDDAKNKVETAENDLAKIRITAPIDGKILNVSKNVGETVAAASSTPSMMFGTSSGSGAITICDTTAIYLTASITEGDIVGITEGQKINVTIDALEEENMTATVYSVSSIPSTDASGIITYEVTGKLDSLNEELRDNMSAFLTFVKKEKYDVLLVPNKAVYVEGTQQYVNVQLENGSIEKRAITGGLSNGTSMEVVDGLEEGETVVIGSVKA